MKTTNLNKVASLRMSRATLVAIMITCSAGCFLSKPAADRQSPELTSPPAEDTGLTSLIHQASESTKSLKTVHLALTTTGQIDGLAHISNADLDVRVNPLGAQGKVTYDGQTDVPFLLVNESVSVKLFDEWTNIGSVEGLFPPGLIDPSTGAKTILQSLTDPQTHGTETINGFATVKVSGTVPTDASKIMLPKSNSPKNVTVWIRNDGHHEIVQSLVDVGPGSTVTSTLSNWNDPVQIDQPS